MLNTNNKDYITWQYEQLQFAILGGIKVEGLDRLRITIKVSYKQITIRHNLDLYNDSSVDRLVKRCAERFSLGTNSQPSLRSSDHAYKRHTRDSA